MTVRTHSRAISEQQSTSFAEGNDIYNLFSSLDVTINVI